MVDKNQSERRPELSKTGLERKFGLAPSLTMSVEILPKNPDHDESDLHLTPELPDAFENP